MIVKNLNIAIVNAHWNNRGDEAALLAIIKGLKSYYTDSKITIFFKDDKAIKQFPEIKNVDFLLAKFNEKIWDIWLASLTRGKVGINKTLKKTIKNLTKSQLIIYSPGGSVINKRFFWRKQMEYLVPFICAKLYKIPMKVAAPSIGPFDTEKPNRLIKWLLKTPVSFCVREEISRKYLEEIGLLENIYVTIDSAFYDEVNITQNQKKLDEYVELNKFLASHGKVIGITITDFGWHVKYGKDKELVNRINQSFIKFIKMLTEKGYGIVFIPQLFGNQNDYNYMNKFSVENIFTMNDKLDCFFQQFLISKLYAVVGMRYHSNIFSAKMGVPFIPIIYEEKMEGFIQQADLQKYSLTLNDLSFEQLSDKWQELEQNHISISRKIQEKQPVWKEKALKTIELLTND